MEEIFAMKKKKLYNDLKACLRGELLRCRAALNIPQEEMAHRLLMSTRAYSALESGKSCCSLITAFLFFSRCCLDQAAFLDGILRILEPSE